MELFLLDIISKYPIVLVVLTVLGLIVVLAQAIVAITPGKSDDEFLAKLESNAIAKKILDILISFAPIQKSEKKGFELSSKSVGK